MTPRVRSLTAVLAALALSSCSSTPSPSGGAGDMDPGAVSGQGSLTGESAAGAESGGFESAAGAESGGSESPSGSEASGRPGGIGRSGGQTGGEAGIHCNADVALEPLDYDAVSPLGYSAAQIIDALGPSYAATFSYADDSTTELAVRLTSEALAAYAPGCSRIAIDVAVDWSTADGGFDETLRGKLFALSPDVATLDVEVPASDFVGSYVRTHAAQLVPAPIRFSFAIEFTPSEVHGSVSALRGAPDAQDSFGIGGY